MLVRTFALSVVVNIYAVQTAFLAVLFCGFVTIAAVYQGDILCIRIKIICDVLRIIIVNLVNVKDLASLNIAVGDIHMHILGVYLVAEIIFP